MYKISPQRYLIELDGKNRIFVFRKKKVTKKITGPKMREILNIYVTSYKIFGIVLGMTKSQRKGYRNLRE